MQFKVLAIFVAVALALAVMWYLAEPYTATFMDDGPYYSSDFSDPTTELPVYSRIELRRFGHLVYMLESRLHSELDQSVLVLTDPKGSIQWSRIPIKPDGELGPIKFHRANVTWYGGWRIIISPRLQESGVLYLDILGGFRFFNHSW